jgi:hypothetical protein
MLYPSSTVRGWNEARIRLKSFAERVSCWADADSVVPKVAGGTWNQIDL